MTNNMLEYTQFQMATEYKPSPPTVPVNEDVKKEEEALHPCPNMKKYASDIAALEDAFGVLQGQTIEIELREILRICPRERRRSDAYVGLISKLKEISCKLIIKSEKIRNAVVTVCNACI